MYTSKKLTTMERRLFINEFDDFNEMANMNSLDVQKKKKEKKQQTSLIGNRLISLLSI